MSIRIDAYLSIFSQNSDYFVTVQYEYIAKQLSIFIYEKETFTLCNTITESKTAPIKNVYISPDSRFIMATAGNKLKIWKREDTDRLVYKTHASFRNLNKSIWHHKNIIGVLHEDEHLYNRIHFYDLDNSAIPLYKSQYACELSFVSSMSDSGLLVYYNSIFGFYVSDYNTKTDISLGEPTIGVPFELCWLNNTLLIKGDVEFSLLRRPVRADENGEPLRKYEPCTRSLIHAFDFSESIQKHNYYSVVLPPRHLDAYLTLIHKTSNDTIVLPTNYHPPDSDHHVWLFELDGPNIKVIKKKRFYEYQIFVPYDKNHFLMIDTDNKSVTVFDYLTPRERLEQILLCGIITESGFNKFLMRGLYDPRLFLLIAEFSKVIIYYE